MIAQDIQIPPLDPGCLDPMRSSTLPQLDELLGRRPPVRCDDDAEREPPPRRPRVFPGL